MAAEMKATGRGIGIGGILVGVFLMALVLALGWSLFTFVLGTIALALKIALVLLVIVGILVLIGMIRTHVLKR